MTHWLDKIRSFAATPLARKLVFGLFIIQAVALVFVVKIGVPPDETNHIRFIEFYAEHSVSPFFSEQEPTYNLGDKTREVGYIYHYVMSLLYRMLPVSADGAYAVIRLCSVAFGVLTFMVLSRVFKRLGLSAATITTALLIMTNLPMVLMLSAAVNNDALIWLGMALALLLLLRLWQKPALLDLLALANLAVLGGLVKRTFLPLGVLFGVLGLIAFIKKFRRLHIPKKPNWKIIAASLLLVIGIGLFVERVGGNLVRYGGVRVTCEQVHSQATCHDFWANIRARKLAKLPPETPLSLPEFVGRWFGTSLYGITNIQTQNWYHEATPPPWLTPLLALILAAGLGYASVYERIRFVTTKQSQHRVYIILIAVYFIIVHLVFNYGVYKDEHVFGLALNGRYILPSVLPLIGLVCFYWSRMLHRYPRPQTLLALGVIAVLLAGSGLSLMLRNPQLYTGQPSSRRPEKQLYPSE